jgi:hypothetical protein
MNRLAAAGAALALALIAGCGTHHAAAPKATPTHLTTLQACHALRSDIVRDGGTLDQKTADYVKAHTGPGKLHDDLAANDIEGDNQAGDQWIYLGLLAYDCRRSGVVIPTP